MTRQLYELKHPLYPHPDLLRYYQDHKILYVPQQGSYDSTYNNWYQLVRADHDISGAPKRPIYREISQIVRFKSSGKEFLQYGETLYGFDHENNQIPFFHTYGSYLKPVFKNTYNYEERKAYTIIAGGNETIHFIEFDKKLLEELYAAGPDDQDIELLVNVGSKQYGGRGFYSYDEFRDSPFEELATKGREGKGMFTQPIIQTPAGTLSAELKAAGGLGGGQQQSQLYKEFLEFQKFKQSQQQSSQPQTQQQQKNDKR
jgi:hypothetical protein